MRYRISARCLLALCAGVIVLAALWIWRTQSQREPVYQGKSLQVWLRQFDQPHDSKDYRDARAAILAMGTNVLPHLEGYLRRRDWRYHRQWIRLQARLKILRPPTDYDFLWHRRAATACGQFGEAGAAAFPAMMEAATSRQAEGDVAWSLSWMLPSSAPVLTNLLASTNPTTRYRAADALATAPSHPSVEIMARTALLNALRDPDSGLRMSAASALGVSARAVSSAHREVVIPALIKTLDDAHASVRGNAAVSLGEYGTNAYSAVPRLLEMLQDPDRHPRESAKWSLRRINPAVAEAGETE